MATISINSVMGEDGLIQKAEFASESERAAKVKEQVEMWKLERQLSSGVNAGGTQTRVEILEKLLERNLITESEKETVEETNSVTIAGQVINFGEKTLVDMYAEAEKAECIGGESCTDPENHLHIGDYVNYQNPTSGTYTSYGTNTGMKRASDKGEIVASDDLNQVYKVANNQLNWRVLGIDEETGGLKLITGSPMKKEPTSNNPYLMMYGAKSYTEGINELNKICGLYKNNYAITARSVNIDDVNAITGVTSVEKIKEVNLNYFDGLKQYGDAYSHENHYTPESWLNNETKTTVSGIVDGYYYGVNIPANEGIPSATVKNERAYNLLFDNVEYETGACYWLASRGVAEGSDNASFGPGFVYSIDGLVITTNHSEMFISGSGSENTDCFAVRPVVVLKSEVTEEQVGKTNQTETEVTWNYGSGA